MTWVAIGVGGGTMVAGLLKGGGGGGNSGGGGGSNVGVPTSYMPGQTMDYNANPMLASMLAQQANTDNRSSQLNQQRFQEGQGKGSAINDYLASAYGKILGVNFGGMGGGGGQGGGYGGGNSYSGMGGGGQQGGGGGGLNYGGYQPAPVNYTGRQAPAGQPQVGPTPQSDIPLIDQITAQMGVNPSWGEKMLPWDQYQASGQNPFKSYADWQKAAQQHDTYHTAVNQIIPKMMGAGYTLEDLGIYDEADKGKALYNAYRDNNALVKQAKQNGTMPLMMPSDVGSAMGIYKGNVPVPGSQPQTQGQTPQTGQLPGQKMQQPGQPNTSSSMAPPQGNYNNNPSMPPMGPPQMSPGATNPVQPTEMQGQGPTAQTAAQPQYQPQTGQAVVPQPQKASDPSNQLMNQLQSASGNNNPAKYAPSSVPQPYGDQLKFLNSWYDTNMPGQPKPWEAISPSGGTASQHGTDAESMGFPASTGETLSAPTGITSGGSTISGTSGLGNWGGGDYGSAPSGSSSYGYSTGNGQSFDPNQNSTWAQFLAPSYNKVSQLGDQQMRELRSALPRGGQQDSAISGAINSKYSALQGGWQGLVPQAMQGLAGIGSSYYNQSALGQTGGVGNASNYELGLKGLQSSGVGQANNYNLGIQGLQSSERNSQRLAESGNNAAQSALFGQVAGGLATVANNVINKNNSNQGFNGPPEH